MLTNLACNLGKYDDYSHISRSSILFFSFLAQYLRFTMDVGGNHGTWKEVALEEH